MKIPFLLLCLWLLLCIKTTAQNNLPPIYEINADTAYINLPDSSWQMLEDPDGNWTINQVNQSSFTKNFHGDMVVAYPVDTYWMRYRLKNNLPHEVKIYVVGFAYLFDL